MENTSLREYIRTVFTVVLFVLILFFGVHLLSWGDASIRESLPALPDDVYGYGEAEKAPQADALPTNPVLRVYPLFFIFLSSNFTVGAIASLGSRSNASARR